MSDFHSKYSDRTPNPLRFPNTPGDVLPLHLNESYNLAPDSFIRSFRDAISNTIVGRYPTHKKLEEKIAEYVGVGENELLLTAGSDQGIELVIRGFLEGKKLALPIPSFIAYEYLAKIYNVEICSIEYSENTLLEEDLLSALETSDAIAISNPGNPIGTTLSREVLIKIIEKGKEQGKIVIVDEAYFEFFGETVVDLVQKCPNLIVLRTFSKAFGLAGARVGVLAANSSFVDQIAKLQLPCPISSLSLLAVSVALDHKKDFEESRKEYIQVRESLEKKLEDVGYKVVYTKTNFLLLETGENTEKMMETFLNKYKIAVFGNVSSNFVRIAVPDKKEAKTLLKALTEVHRYLQI